MCTHTVTFADVQDAECAARGLLGFTTRAIARETGLSPWQVQYRLSKARIKRQDYRNGVTAIAKHMLFLGKAVALRQVKRDIAPRFIPMSANRTKAEDGSAVRSRPTMPRLRLLHPVRAAA